MLMYAYGSNLNVEQMSYRCPAARKIGRYRLRNWQLVFRGVADCVPAPDMFCYGGIWDITAACERSLDNYEGVPAMYRKEYLSVRIGGADVFEDMLIYTMNSDGIFPPSKTYLASIVQGYLDFGMSKKGFATLRQAVRNAHDEKHPSHVERRRHRRNGRPQLAIRPKGLLQLTEEER